MRFEDDYFVRKISATIDYNERLKRQVAKQRSLIQFIPVAKIIDEHMIDGLYAYDMEYIAGRDFRSQCLEEPAAWIFRFTDSLFDTIRTLSAQGGECIPVSSFIAKCEDLTRNITAHPNYSDARMTLATTLARMPTLDWSQVPMTGCHGDLTIENIMFCDNGRLVYIDVLDGDLCSYWIDLSKLLFDLEIGWSLRHIVWEPNSASNNEARLLSMMNRYLREEISSRTEQIYVEFSGKAVQFKALQALRILPYTADKSTFLRLCSYVEQLEI